MAKEKIDITQSKILSSLKIERPATSYEKLTMSSNTSTKQTVMIMKKCCEKIFFSYQTNRDLTEDTLLLKIHADCSSSHTLKNLFDPSLKFSLDCFFFSSSLVRLLF